MSKFNEFEAAQSSETSHVIPNSSNSEATLQCLSSTCNNLTQSNQSELSNQNSVLGNQTNISKSVKSNGQKLTGLAHINLKSDNTRNTLLEIQKELTAAKNHWPASQQVNIERSRYLQVILEKLNYIIGKQDGFNHQSTQYLATIANGIANNHVVFNASALDEFDHIVRQRTDQSLPKRVRYVKDNELNKVIGKNFSKTNHKSQKILNRMSKISDDQHHSSALTKDHLNKLRKSLWIIVAVIGSYLFTVIPSWLRYFTLHPIITLVMTLAIIGALLFAMLGGSNNDE